MKRKSERKNEEFILQERLESLLENKRDGDYTKSNVKIAAEIGIPYNTFRKYVTEKGDSSECSISNLSKIADYFKVSTDFLLGRTDTSSLNEDIQTAASSTGLSESNIAVLQSNQSAVYASNLLLSNPHFLELAYRLVILSALANRRNEDAIGHIPEDISTMEELANNPEYQEALRKNDVILNQYHAEVTFRHLLESIGGADNGKHNPTKE